MNPANLRSTVLAAGSFLLALSASAHPGHGLHEANASHLLTSPDHLMLLAVIGAALWLSGRFVDRRFSRRLLQGAGIAAVLTAAFVWSLPT